jgi:hypothetical protein
MKAKELKSIAAKVRGAVGVAKEYPDLLPKALAEAEAALAKADKILAGLIKKSECSGDSFLAQDGDYERAVRAGPVAYAYGVAVRELRAAVKEAKSVACS